MKKGFTLVELLAVITILGLIVLITAPIVRNTVETQRYKQFQVTIEGMMNAITEDSALDDYEFPRRYEYKTINGKKDLYLIVASSDSVGLQISGTIKYNPKVTILVNQNNVLKVYVENDKYCAVKRETDEEILFGKKIKDEEEHIHCIMDDEDKTDLNGIILELKNM